MESRQKVGFQMRTAFLVAGALVLAVAFILVALVEWYSPVSRKWVVNALQNRYHSKVELGAFRVAIFPRISITGENLILHYQGRTDIPFVSIRKFTIQTGLFGVLRSPKKIQSLRLEGLQIYIPPHREASRNGNRQEHGNLRPAFLLQQVIADGTFLEILPKQPGKEPHQFEIKRLRLTSVAVDQPMSFTAELTNPKPPGLIETQGKFGPWHTQGPDETPVSGAYTFRNADLSVFRGIAGILSSEGKYHGELGRIEVDGTTDVPEFSLRVSGHPVPLQTEFHAIVDGTTGDTLLEPVHAHLRRSTIIVQGGVMGSPGRKGKTVSLDGTANQARLEDVLWLAVKGDQPLMTGAIRFRSKIRIPAGPEDVIDKLYLNGQFGTVSTRFNNSEVQEKVEAFSARARGKPEEGDKESVTSQFEGGFVLKNGTVTLSNLSFAMPGAAVQLDGTYGLRTEELKFQGTVQLQAKLSELTTGAKSVLLKMVDPLFKTK